MNIDHHHYHTDKNIIIIIITEENDRVLPGGRRGDLKLLKNLKTEKKLARRIDVRPLSRMNS
jgi:hypothetical protein